MEKLCVTNISYEEIAMMLDLPPGIEIISVDQDPDDRVNRQLRVFISGKGPNHEPGCKIWNVGRGG